MPPVRFTVFKRHARVIAVIFLLSKIMPIYFCYTKKKLIYIAIIALSSYQPFSYFKYTKLNIYSFYDVLLVFNAKYMCFTRLYNL